MAVEKHFCSWIAIKEKDTRQTTKRNEICYLFFCTTLTHSVRKPECKRITVLQEQKQKKSLRHQRMTVFRQSLPIILLDCVNYSKTICRICTQWLFKINVCNCNNTQVKSKVVRAHRWLNKNRNITWLRTHLQVGQVIMIFPVKPRSMWPLTQIAEIAAGGLCAELHGITNYFPVAWFLVLGTVTWQSQTWHDETRVTCTSNCN